jgi:hypothetical protein
MQTHTAERRYLIPSSLAPSQAVEWKYRLIPRRAVPPIRSKTSNFHSLPRAAQQLLVLGVVGHCDRLIDQQHRDAVLDPVRAAQPWVVEQLVIADQK